MKHLIAFALLAGGLTLAGCSDDKPKGDLPPLHPAKGKVTRGGAPAAGGSVQFKADPPKPGSDDLMVNAEVKADGTFDLETIHALSMKKGAGAPAGTYKVTFVPPQGAQQSGAGPVAVPKPVTVAEGPNDLTIELPGKR